jgi:hypothetical protein
LHCVAALVNGKGAAPNIIQVLRNVSSACADVEATTWTQVPTFQPNTRSNFIQKCHRGGVSSALPPCTS